MKYPYLDKETELNLFNDRYNSVNKDKIFKANFKTIYYAAKKNFLLSINKIKVYGEFYSFDELLSDYCLAYETLYKSFDNTKNTLFRTYLNKYLYHKVAIILSKKVIDLNVHANLAIKLFFKDKSPERLVATRLNVKIKSTIITECVEPLELATYEENNKLENYEVNDIHRVLSVAIHNMKWKKELKDSILHLYNINNSNYNITEVGKYCNVSRATMFERAKTFMQVNKEFLVEYLKEYQYK
jgi:hypothetical protein